LVVEGIMWKRHQWVCAMRSFLTMSNVYPEVWHMLKSITIECERVKAVNQKTKNDMQKAETRSIAEAQRWRQEEVARLRGIGETQQADELEGQAPDDPARTKFLNMINDWSPTAATASTAEASTPTMMVMRHRGSMPRNARLLPRV
jgi:hypothetical protein